MADKKNLLYPCNSKEVERQDKLYCYLLVTSHILPYVGGDWVKTADWCRRSERGLGRYCFQSYGRDVAGAAVRDPAQMKNLCGMAGSGEKECIYGAIRDVMNNNPQDPQGEAFCELVKADVQGLLLLRDGNDPRHPARRPGGQARGLRAVGQGRGTSPSAWPAPAPRRPALRGRRGSRRG